MYIRIKTRCNFSCAHCGFSCDANGIDMDFATFRKAIKIAKQKKGVVTLGGGEPTIHRDFWRFFNYALDKLGKGNVSIVTNGSQTETTLKLADLTDKGIITSFVSLDEYHEPIDSSVADRYKQMKRASEIGAVKNQGRGINIVGSIDGCLTRKVTIDADGKIYTCSCMDEYLGTVDKYKFPSLDCSHIDHNAYQCFGYCSKHGHLLLEKGLPEKEYKAAVRIKILDLMGKYYQKNITESELDINLERLLIESGMNRKEFEGMIDSIVGEI